MRISGFASGMDIDNMVKELMQAKREPLNKLNQQMQLLQWKRESYREVSTKIVSFRNDKLFSLTNTFAMNAKKAEVTGINNSAISVAASNSSTNLDIEIQVDQVATAAQAKIKMVSNTPGGQVTRDTVLSDITGGDNVLPLFINGTEITGVSSSDKVSTLLSKINQSGAGVTASFDTATQTIYLTNKQTGRTDLNGNDTSKVRISSDVDGTLPSSGIFNNPDHAEAQNAKYRIGAKGSIEDLVFIESSSNTINYDGLTVTLKQPTKNGDNAYDTLTISTKPDTDKLIEAVKSFVNDYNSLIASINSKLDEERYRKYAPLSDDQKKEMSEDEIKLWNEKAQSGMLKNDDIVSSLISDVRTAITGSVKTSDGEFSIFKAGISTGKWNEGGKLVIENEEALRSAIEQNPGQFIDFFSSKGTTVTETQKKEGVRYNEDTGIFNRISSLMNDTLSRLADRAGTSRVSSDLSSAFMPASQMGEQARDLDLRISDMKSRLTRLETSYYKQFTAMETAINKYNSISGGLQSYL